MKTLEHIGLLIFIIAFIGGVIYQTINYKEDTH